MFFITSVIKSVYIYCKPCQRPTPPSRYAYTEVPRVWPGHGGSQMVEVTHSSHTFMPLRSYSMYVRLYNEHVKRGCVSSTLVLDEKNRLVVKKRICSLHKAAWCSFSCAAETPAGTSGNYREMAHLIQSSGRFELLFKYYLKSKNASLERRGTEIFGPDAQSACLCLISLLKHSDQLWQTLLSWDKLITAALLNCYYTLK